MFNLFFYPTQGKILFVSMFAIDQQVNMSSCPIAFGSPAVVAFLGFCCSTHIYVLVFSQTGHWDDLQCRTKVVLHNHFSFPTSERQPLTVFLTDLVGLLHFHTAKENDQTYCDSTCVREDESCYFLP